MLAALQYTCEVNLSQLIQYRKQSQNFRRLKQKNMRIGDCLVLLFKVSAKMEVASFTVAEFSKLKGFAKF